MSSSWPVVALGDVLRRMKDEVLVRDGQSYGRLTIRMNGRGILPRDRLDGAEIGTKRQFAVRAGQLVLSKIDARNGAFGILPVQCDGAIITGNFWAFDSDDKALVPEFLDYMTRTPTFLDFCVRSSEGSTNRRYLQEDLFLAQEMPLPPLAEQQRIVARIKGVAKRVEEARRLHEQSVKAADAIMVSATSAILGHLQVLGTLSDVLLEKPRNGWSPKCDNMENGTPVLTLSAVTGFRYNGAAVKRTSEVAVQGAHYWLQPGDLLVNRSNTPELVGHAAVYDGSPSPCIYPDLMMKLKPNPHAADSRFIWTWLQTSLVRDYIRRNAKGTSPTMKKVSQSVVNGIPFPSGIPLVQQLSLVRKLDAIRMGVEGLAELLQKVGAEADVLLPAVLDRAFKGEQ